MNTNTEPLDIGAMHQDCLDQAAKLYTQTVAKPEPMGDLAAIASIREILAQFTSGRRAAIMAFLAFDAQDDQARSRAKYPGSAALFSNSEAA